jgi:UDP-glucuronate 4-epimerase
LVTGAAGFIGCHVSRELLKQGYSVVGIDNLNDYYDVGLKHSRLALLEGADFDFHRADFADKPTITSLFERNRFDAIVHLGAQAGVRYSLENPDAYIQSNIVGTANLLESARQNGVRHFVYASSSSVYGMNRKLPFNEDDSVDHPISLYAATKKADELMAHTYSHLFQLPTTGLRFFTVYGPWGRPDMAAFKFTEAILKGRAIEVYNDGRMRRDFTYIDDIVEGTVEIMKLPAAPDPNWNAEAPHASSSSAPYRIYNIGNHQSVELLKFIEELERAVGKRAIKNFLPMQPGDVLETYAATDRLSDACGFRSSTPIETGLPRFVAWFRDYYRL